MQECWQVTPLPVPPCTKLLTLVVSGNHREHIHLYLIPSSSAGAVLGIPWLARHNPHVNWATSVLAGWSIFCHAHCLQSAIPPSLGGPVIPLTCLIFPLYWRCTMILKKPSQKSFPTHPPPPPPTHHCPDCAICLLPGALLPSNLLYNLSQPERDTMESHM